MSLVVQFYLSNHFVFCQLAEDCGFQAEAFSDASLESKPLPMLTLSGASGSRIGSDALANSLMEAPLNSSSSGVIA